MIKKDIFGNTTKEQLKAAQKDRLYSFLLSDGSIRGAIVKSTRMINEMRANHVLGIVETLLLGHTYIAAALLTSNLKGNDRLSLGIKCSGPVKGIDVESNAFGEVRGFLKNSHIDIKNPEKVKSLSQFFGAGFLTVTKYIEDAKSPYSGQIMLEHGSIAEDLANYFLQSEQTPTGFNLSINFDSKGEVAGAGGIFLQAMPDADNDKLVKAEKILQSIESIGHNFAEKTKPEDLILKSFEELNPVFIGNRRIEFFCRCSKKKVSNYVSKLPKKELDNILAESVFPLETTCHHCNSVYGFSKKEIENFKS
ncbi:MAG: Hsp33 family molecular chaperone HslO [Desulfobacterales bacterium]|nr:Hsp33 family molecular chaperone HslO [Desulfobacterales bacterium]